MSSQPCSLVRYAIHFYLAHTIKSNPISAKSRNSSSNEALSLACQNSSIHEGTYAGAISNPDIFPNILYHFHPHNGWPGAPISLMIQLTSRHLVSVEATQYFTMNIDIYDPSPLLLPLLKTDIQTAYKEHQASTPQCNA